MRTNNFFIRIFLLAILIFGIVIANHNSTLAAPIDLTEATGGFVISDPNYVIFGSDINEATLLENDVSGLTWLSNDPFLGGPGIFVPANASTLTFDLNFFTTGNDSFEVLLLDSLGGTPFFNFFHDGTIKGPGAYQYDNVPIDLISLNLLGTVVGLEFDLISNFGDTTFDSVLNITNVSFNEDLNSVPVPSSLLLLGFGILSLGLFVKK
ncbi:MAG: hypothetical protein K8S13_08280 [Desulfobacula sp.]|uniref:hypothetical protein n=1 Tax=Desulfobacula sp. TaxID=2593537 RepID=UPI0025B83DCC|nr:hypothetical protein [Desulfobacula sp.]MCD4719844.1 hypothetical protein [Desulfobacula sp.]